MCGVLCLCGCWLFGACCLQFVVCLVSVFWFVGCVSVVVWAMNDVFFRDVGWESAVVCLMMSDVSAVLFVNYYAMFVLLCLSFVVWVNALVLFLRFVFAGCSFLLSCNRNHNCFGLM